MRYGAIIDFKAYSKIFEESRRSIKD